MKFNLKKFKFLKKPWVLYGIIFVLIYLFFGWGLFYLLIKGCGVRNCILFSSGPLTIIIFPLYIYNLITGKNYYSDPYFLTQDKTLYILIGLLIYFILGAVVGLILSLAKKTLKRLIK